MKGDNFNSNEGYARNRKTAIPKRGHLRSIPPRTTMRDRTGDGGSIQDLPARLLEIQKRLQYVAQEVEKAREKGEDVTPKMEFGGCLNIGGNELDLNDISNYLNIGEGIQGLEKMLNLGELEGLLKKILGDLDIEKLKSAMEEYSKSSGYDESGKKPVIATNIKVRELGQDPKEWTGLSGSGAGTIADKNKGSGTTGFKYRKDKKQNPYKKRASGSAGSVGSINRSSAKGHTGQKIEKKVRKVTGPARQGDDFKLKDIVEQELDYEILPKGDKNYEVIVNELGIKEVESIRYDRGRNVLLINEQTEIPLKKYKIKDVLGWEYRNDVLTINLEK